MSAAITVTDSAATSEIRSRELQSSLTWKCVALVAGTSLWSRRGAFGSYAERTKHVKWWVTKRVTQLDRKIYLFLINELEVEFESSPGHQTS